MSLMISALERRSKISRQARPAISLRVSYPGGSDPVSELDKAPQECHSMDATRVDAIVSPGDDFLHTEQEHLTNRAAGGNLTNKICMQPHCSHWRPVFDHCHYPQPRSTPV